jgi:hypothetical protein
MKVLSIDVGIKNLAYCLFEYDDNISQLYQETTKLEDVKMINILDSIKIVLWDVVDICKTGNEPKCCFNGCNTVPKFYKADSHYCRKHAKNGTYKTPTSKQTMNYIKKQKVQAVKKIVNDFKLDPIKHKCKKKDDYLSLIEDHLQQNYLDAILPINANTMTLVELGGNIMNNFDAIFEDQDIDMVLIENQISPIANRMKTIQGMIAQYFIMTNVTRIEFVSASNKLKPFLTDSVTGKCKKTTYSERKKLGIDVMNDILKNHENVKEWHDAFKSHKKKDDLADSFLQGYSWAQL